MWQFLEHIKHAFKLLNKKTECKLITPSYLEDWCLSIFCTALWLIILIVAIFGLWSIQSEKIKAVRPRVRLDKRNPW